MALACDIMIIEPELYALKFTTASRGFPATARLSCWFLPGTHECHNDDSNDEDDEDDADHHADRYHGYC